MANKKQAGLGRGLGRGLGALVGGSTYEKQELDKEQEQATPAVFQTTDPAEAVEQVKEQSKDADSVVEPEAEAIKDNEEKDQESEAPSSTTDRIDLEETVLEDNITIKSVASREVKPQKKGYADSKKKVTGKAGKTQKKPEVKPTDEIDINLIEPNPDQPRNSFKREELEELAASIERDGLLQPILVRRVDKEKYQIIAGERRYQACKSLNMKKVPVRVKDATDSKALELALIENIHRCDLNPIEEAYGYRRIMERQKKTQAELAQMLSKGRSTIANALRLLDLPEDAQQLLFEEKITAGHARAILAVSSKESRQKLTEKLVNERLSVRETENIARLLSNRSTTLKTKKPAPPASYKAVALDLKKKLNTPVKVKTSKGKNKIEIEFTTEEDLRRIFKELMNE